VYTGRTAAIFDILDGLFREFFLIKYKARDIKTPSIISSNVIKKAGYFETGCQHISFVAPISNDPYILEEFSKISDYSSVNLFKYLKTPKDVLNPAMCLHCYPLFENHTLDEPIKVMTLMGSCFRDESGNLNNSERLNEFKMREVVYFGEEQLLKIIHNELIDFLINFGKFFELNFKLEVSNDIFFNDNAEKQLFSQLITNNKIEFQVYIKDLNKYIACASINKHGSHFSEAFNIKGSTGDFASTMCIGFGLDRLYLALGTGLEKNQLKYLTEKLLRNGV
ncbi:MAG: hypothetical protein IAE91_11250, partial [Ignavibacteriaceae bacterium]|nr:hypothetical protein [Ignavibacteriaceae bacterium]